jgi:formamidopyrimidine-DNA glycosylase
MSGSLVCEDDTDRRATPPDRSRNHRHVVWTLDSGRRLVFRDPRRFGGIWTFDSQPALLAARWASLGPDALAITPRRLREALGATARPIKAALLDQSLIAGLGNIYVDELLFRCRIHPLTPADRLAADHCAADGPRRLVAAMRRLLHSAIARGGSSVRDYVNANGSRGRFQQRHHVYGRAGLPCRRCAAPLISRPVAGRTTVFCPICQSTHAS